jgi:hypothetical protein
MRGGTPVAGFILIHPGVQIKSVEGDTLLTDRDFSQIGPDFGLEAVPVHTQVMRRVPEADQAG